MKYMLKAKRWGLMRYLYDNCRKYGTTDQVLFFDSEKDVLNFFKFTLEEDIGEKTASLSVKTTSYHSARCQKSFETVMKIASSCWSFREILKNDFNWFKRRAYQKEDGYTDRWVVGHLKCNPANYKIFTIQEQEIRGYKFQKVELFTWYKFYKNCLASGMAEEEIVFNGEG
jgi:hypothetical protein